MKKFYIAMMIFIILTLSACSSIKKAEDYTAVDYVKIQNISFGIRNASDEELRKYDINNDGVITSIDANIVRQMLDGCYDEYKIKNKKHIAIKYISY